MKLYVDVMDMDKVDNWAFYKTEDGPIVYAKKVSRLKHITVGCFNCKAEITRTHPRKNMKNVCFACSRVRASLTDKKLQLKRKNAEDTK